MAEQYISIKQIHDRVLRHPLLQGVTLDSVVDYAVDFMRIVGVPNIFENKVAELVAKDHIAKLPCDYIRTIQMRGSGGMYRKATGTFHYSPHGDHGHPKRPAKLKDERCGGCHYIDQCGNEKWDYNSPECVVVLRAVTPMPKRMTGNYYRIQNSTIHISHPTDTLELSYLAVKTDSEGYPMIPEDPKFVRALVAYIKKEEFTIMFDIGTIQPAVLQNAQQEYAWAVGAASSAANELDLPSYEAISNAMHGMINRTNEWDAGFVSNGAPLVFKKH